MIKKAIAQFDIKKQTMEKPVDENLATKLAEEQKPSAGVCDEHATPDGNGEGRKKPKSALKSKRIPDIVDSSVMKSVSFELNLNKDDETGGAKQTKSCPVSENEFDEEEQSDSSMTKEALSNAEEFDDHDDLAKASGPAGDEISTPKKTVNPRSSAGHTPGYRVGKTAPFDGVPAGNTKKTATVRRSSAGHTPGRFVVKPVVASK